jgi:hypothetical protein
LTLPGGQKVNVTGEDILKYQEALNQNELTKRQLEVQMMQAQSLQEYRNATEAMRRVQEQELQLKMDEKRATLQMVKEKDNAGTKVPGTDLSYGEAYRLGPQVLTELLRQDQQNRNLDATASRQQSHDARVMYQKLMTDIQTQGKAKQAKMSMEQYVDRQMQAYGTNWKSLVGLKSNEPVKFKFNPQTGKIE